MKSPFREKFAAFLKKVNPKVVKMEDVVQKDSIILVTRVVDFDPASNAIWEITDNKSHPHLGLTCFGCGQPVVMSDGIWKQYSTSKLKNKHKLVWCGRCGMKHVMKELSHE